MANRSDQDEDTPSNVQGFYKPAEQNGASPAQTIRASGSTPRKQAGHKTASDPVAKHQRTPCNAGAIHTGHSLAIATFD